MSYLVDRFLLTVLISLVCLFTASSAHAFNFEPEYPDFESQFVEVHDMIFSHPSGTVVVEIPYLAGTEMLRRIRITTKSGYETVIIFPGLGEDTFNLMTPGDDWQFKKLSGNRVRATNMNTGESGIADADDHVGWEFDWPSNNQLNQWQRELKDFYFAWQAETVFPEQSLVSTYLPQKHITIGTLQSQFGGTIDCRVSNGVDECGAAVAEAVGTGVSAAVGCAIPTIWAAPIAGGCAIAGVLWTAWQLPKVKAICDRCAAAQGAPPGTIPDDDGSAGGGGAGQCIGSLCSNFTGPRTPGLTCGCELWLEQENGSLECLRRGCW